MKKKVIAIVGPTAVGKTATTVTLARHYSTVVLNADSRQVFKEIKVGTAKPDREDLMGVVHYFIDDRSITEEFSAGHFEAEGLKILDEEFQNRDLVIVSGGSGLYVDALCEGLSSFPEVDQEVRSELMEAYHEKGIEYLQKEILRLDPAYAKTADFDNPQRLVRALEVSIFSGKPYSEYRVGAARPRPFSTIYVGLELPRQELYSRINSRMDLMIENGLFEEARRVERFVGANALKTIGYKEIYGYFNGEYDYDEAVRLLKRNSRRFAKRQMTWFKKNSRIEWFNPADVNSIINYIDSEIR